MFCIDTIVLIFQILFYKVTNKAQKDQIKLENDQDEVERKLERDIKDKLKETLRGKIDEKDDEMIDKIPISQNSVDPKKQAARTDIEIKLSEHI